MKKSIVYVSIAMLLVFSSLAFIITLEIDVFKPTAGANLRGDVQFVYDIEAGDPGADCEIYYVLVNPDTGEEFQSEEPMLAHDCVRGSNTVYLDTLSAGLSYDQVYFKIESAGSFIDGGESSVILVDNTIPLVELDANTEAEVGEEISFTLTATDNSPMMEFFRTPAGSGFDNPNSFLIDYADGDSLVTDSLVGVKHTYSESGEYPVRFTATDDVGLKSSATLTIRVSAVEELPAEDPLEEEEIIEELEDKTEAPVKDEVEEVKEIEEKVPVKEAKLPAEEKVAEEKLSVDKEIAKTLEPAADKETNNSFLLLIVGIVLGGILVILGNFLARKR